MAVLGATLVTKKDIRNNDQWFGNEYKPGDYVVAQLLEPPVEKQKSFKALAEVAMLVHNGETKKVQGKVLLYFRKDSNIEPLDYGSQILFKKELLEIKNAGNPGSFNYRQFCLFQGITHQVNSLSTHYVLLPEKKTRFFESIIFEVRKRTVATLQKYIFSERDAGLAEALLIGYKNDLDKDLVQAYSNTGVVHIIAISGLHLGLIYCLLDRATRRFRKNKKTNWARLILIVAMLWVFSFIAGMQPSVMRSAVMFTCLAIGEAIGRKSSMLNTLLFSAFLLLCINPFWLWDVGFRLSYTAVLSLIIFFRPIYNWMAPAGMVSKWIWSLVSATLAAQILTLPLVLYHFHQFPLLFLVANVFAVPWSSGILICELVLLAVSFFEPAASFVGWVLQVGILLMNMYVEKLSAISFATWNGFYISIWQTVFLYGFLAAVGYWLLEQNKKAIWMLLGCAIGFIMLRSFSFYEAYHQKKMIVYNVPRRQAIDLVEGRTYRFIGDKDLVEDDFIRNFHLQPSRIAHRTTATKDDVCIAKNFYFGHKKIMIIDSAVKFLPAVNKKNVDIVVLSKNPTLYISQLANAFAVKEIVMDGSVPFWKKKLWKKDCDSLHLPYYDVADKGAFVMKIQ